MKLGSVEKKVYESLPGSTDNITDRYVNRYLSDELHGVPEIKGQVYSALRRLKKKGYVTSKRQFAGRGSYETYWEQSS